MPMRKGPMRTILACVLLTGIALSIVAIVGAAAYGNAAALFRFTPVPGISQRGCGNSELAVQPVSVAFKDAMKMAFSDKSVKYVAFVTGNTKADALLVSDICNTNTIPTSVYTILKRIW
jgi:hypothetical protein